MIFFPEIYIKLKEEFPPLKRCVVVSIRVFIMTTWEMLTATPHSMYWYA